MSDVLNSKLHRLPKGEQKAAADQIPERKVNPDSGKAVRERGRKVAPAKGTKPTKKTNTKGFKAPSKATVLKLVTTPEGEEPDPFISDQTREALLWAFGQLDGKKITDGNLKQAIKELR